MFDLIVELDDWLDLIYYVWYYCICCCWYIFEFVIIDVLINGGDFKMILLMKCLMKKMVVL